MLLFVGCWLLCGFVVFCLLMIDVCCLLIVVHSVKHIACCLLWAGVGYLLSCAVVRWLLFVVCY